MQLLQRGAHPIVCSAAASRTRQLTRRMERRWRQGQAGIKDSPIKRYLSSALALRDQAVESALALAPSLSELNPSEVQQVVDQNVRLLGAVAPTANAVKGIVLSNPGLLTAPLRAWFDFLSEYGLDARQFWQLLRHHPSLVLQGSVFAAGSAILFLKAIGWSDLEITTTIIPFHAAILQGDVEAQLQPVLEYLVQIRGLSQHAAQQFLHEHPWVLYANNYQNQIQQLLWKQQLMRLQCL